MTREKISRYIIFIVGVLINSFGIALITKATLGTSPISSVPYVLSLKYAPSFGFISFIINSLFIIAQAILLKKDFPPIQWLQFLVNVVFSSFIDFSMYILSPLSPDSTILKLVILILGCAVLGFGISVEVAADVILVPGEGMVKAITARVNKKFGTVKICFDTTLVAIALILSLIFFHGLKGLGIGTIISALLVGKFVNIWNAHLPLISAIRNLDAH